MTVTIHIDDYRAEKLKKLAGDSGLTAENYLLRLIDKEAEQTALNNEILDTLHQVNNGSMETYTGSEMRQRLGLS